MSCSPARLAANQQNALKSTGPKSPDGKAASRLNAFQHGLAGEGALLASGEDSRLVARRANAFILEFKAVGEVGVLLAHRAALLSVRMERSADRDMALVASDARAARDEFDQERLDEVAGWVESLEGRGEPRPLLAALAESPEGVAYLLQTWEKLRDEACSHDQHEAMLAANRVDKWLNLTDDESDAMDAADRARRINGEIDRLRLLLDDVTEATAAARVEAGLMASFDTSPEAVLSRRHEAAAERGMYRAIQAIAALRRAHEREMTSPEAFAEVLSLQRSLAQLPSIPNKETTAPLGSFRIKSSPPESPSSQPLLGPVEPSMIPKGHPKKRPDLRELARNRR